MIHLLFTWKWVIIRLKERRYCKKQNTNMKMVEVKKKLLNIILKTGGFKKNANNKYRSLLEQEKESKREYQRNRYGNMKEKQAKKASSS